jgi:MFS transporter, DHA1 family, solute carrier family 18 (vesicular amine transporter), member 1/2
MTGLRSSRTVAVALVTFATFTDMVAYSVAAPVLPDLSRKLGASPTVIGLLFASFGVTLLTVSMPMGTMSDRIGRKTPMVGGLLALAVATILFAFANSLPWLFAARLVQGAADAVTWVVGFALLADLYDQEERGRVMGLVMSGTNFAFMFGPSIGGWLYESGGMRLPFLFVAALALSGAAAFVWFEIPGHRAARDAVPVVTVLRVPAVAACAAAVVAAAATIAMLEPVLPLFLTATLGIGPARIGLIFGIGAVASTVLHPAYGRMVNRFGARRLTMIGLVLVACVMPLLSLTSSFRSAIGLYVLATAAVAMVITPSLAYMAEATSSAGVGSFGVGYGLYNMAWGAGLLGGPALSGFLFERIGFTRLMLAWSPVLVIVTLLLARVQSGVRLKPDTTETTAVRR